MPELSNEERFFREQEAQLRRKLLAEMEAKAAAAAKKEALTRQLGGREELAQRLHDLGFDADTAPALHLLPLVAVAWIDGQVTLREREAVLQVAAAHGIQPGSKAALLLTSMLEQRPSQTLANEVFDLLHDLLAAKGLHPHSLVEACLEVANASGGFLGLGNKVSPQEQKLIESLNATFSAASRDRVVDRLH